MPHGYEQAVAELYRAPHESFVSERKRLAGALKAEGDKAGAAQLAKLGRPPISAWAVNQLWWHARAAFDELFETAAELRKGKLSASPAHRKALASLNARAQKLLSEAGHGANDATLRRIHMTLAGLAAAGSFEPDAPGTLSKDRDPPGFEAFGIASSSAEPVEDEPKSERSAPTPARAARAPDQPHPRGKVAAKPRIAAHGQPSHESAAAERKRASEAEAAERKQKAEAEAAARKQKAEAEAAERKRAAEAEAKREAERKQRAHDLREAKAELTKKEHERDRLAQQLASAERDLELAQAEVHAAQERLDESTDE